MKMIVLMMLISLVSCGKGEPLQPAFAESTPVPTVCPAVPNVIKLPNEYLEMECVKGKDKKNYDCRQTEGQKRIGCRFHTTNSKESGWLVCWLDNEGVSFIIGDDQ